MRKRNLSSTSEYPGEAMSRSFFRLIHRARSRSQRRHACAWVMVMSIFIFLLIYIQQPTILSYPSRAQTVDGGAQRELVGDRRGPDMKLLGANDVNSNNKFINELGEQEDEDDSRADLLPDLAPPIVHIIWCSEKKFEFRHYLSIKRADYAIKPDKIFFHYQELPAPDREEYYMWFNKTLSENSHIVLKRLNTTNCSPSGAGRYILVLSLLEYFGGIYVPEDAILVDFPVHLRAAQFVSGVVAKTLDEYRDGIIVAKKKSFISPSSQTGLNVVLASGRSASQGTIEPCGSILHFNNEDDGDCICVKVDTEIFPSSIWDSRTKFATLGRLAAYGVSEIRPNFSKRTSIPKIAHYICWGCEINFITYLSIMSSLNVAGLSKVYLHGIKQPTGIWWRRLQATSRVIHVFREYPENSQDRAAMTQESAQGTMRLNILLKYGGVYCDNKVIWTQAIPEDHFGYDAVASPSWHKYGSWPDSMSHTTIMAKKNSEYLLKLRHAHAQNRKHQFWFVDEFLAYRILENNPQVLFLDRHFQVKCRNHNCHPTWAPGYKMLLKDNPPGPEFNWQNDTLSVYWDVFPDLELDTVKYTSGPIVAAARRVFFKSGVLLQDLTTS